MPIYYLSKKTRVILFFSVTSLPHPTKYQTHHIAARHLFMMEKTLTIKKEVIHETKIIHIFRDTFVFQPNSDVQSRLFKRVSKNYAILFLMPIDARHKHVFLMVTAIYLDLSHAPAVWTCFGLTYAADTLCFFFINNLN